MAVARTAALVRHVVIVDGPAAALGVSVGKIVLELLRQVRARRLSVVLSSHNMLHVFELAARVDGERLGRRFAIIDPKRASMSEALSLMTGAVTAEAVT